MKTHIHHASLALLLALPLQLHGQSSPAPAGDTVSVTVENFARAETDVYFSSTVKKGGFGKFDHHRELAPIADQQVIRMNRDTLYSAAVLDLDAGPATITLPEAGTRFMSLQLINEDHYTVGVHYKPGDYTLTREEAGTRYVLVAGRTLVDPVDPADLKKVHALQDALKITQPAPGRFEIPHWDPVTQKQVRDALCVLAATLPDKNRMFGKKADVDPVRHLLGAASAWGGNPDKDAMYLNFVPAKNDGATVYRLTVKDVPVDGFWSISVYDATGYYEPNPHNIYTLNNLTAKKDADGSVTVQFGGCDGKTPNCIPVPKGWNYLVRLYRPRAEVLNGTWKFPEPQPVK